MKKITMTNKRKLECIAGLIIVAIVILSIYRFNMNPPRQIQHYIDRHSHSVYEGPSGYGGVHYKDVSISNSEIKGIGYWRDYFCIYSKTVCSEFIYDIGHVQFIVWCEIAFEWDDYGTTDFYASVYYAKQEIPDEICGWVDVRGLKGDNYPCFSSGTVKENKSGIDNRSIEVESIILASDLLHDVNNFLRLADLPTLY